MKYSFETFKREKIRYAWLNSFHTEESLKEKYYQEYLGYCKEHGLEHD